MSEPLTDSTAVNRTRWGRTSILMAGGLAGSAAIAATLMGTGAYASQYVSTSAISEVTLYGIRTPYNAAFVRGIMTHDFEGNPDVEYVATFQVPYATANDLCLTHKMEMLGEPITLVLNIGDGDTSTNELIVKGINLDIVNADAALSLYGDTSVNQAPSTIDLSGDGAPTVIPRSDEEVGILAMGGAGLINAEAELIGAELIRAEGVPTLDAKIVVGDYTCPSVR